MTAPPPDFVVEAMRRRRESRRPIHNAAGFTIAFVIAGVLITSVTLSPIRTPSDVARAYAEARFARDWSAAWDLLCSPARTAVHDYRAYADAASETFRVMPYEVDVSTGRTTRVGASEIAVPVTVTSPEYRDWELHGHVVLVLENARFRVCEVSLTPV
jgi:hypothetical protein